MWFWWLAASADAGWLAEWCQLIQTHTQDPRWAQARGHLIFGGSIYRTQRMVMALHIFVSLRGTAENFEFFLLDLCWGRGLAIPARLCHCCCYPDTTTDLDCWCSLDMFASGWSCHCWPVNWTADFLTVHTGVAPKNHFLNRSTSPTSFLFHYLWWVVGYKGG